MGTSFSEDEISALRRDTPAAGRYAHFAHGSASLPPLPVFQAQQTWLDDERRLGSHRAAELHGDALSDVKASVGRLINAKPQQIALLGSASQAWSGAMGALLESGRRIHVITTDLEYGSNAIYILAKASRQKLSYSMLHFNPALASLDDSIGELLDRIPSGTTPVVCIALVSAAWGVKVSLGEVTRQIHARGGLLFLDASHAVGQLPVDMVELDCDVLVFPSRKWLRGPKGIGVLCISDRAMQRLGPPPSADVAGTRWVDGSSVEFLEDARRFEGYEFNPGLRLALRAACDYATNLGVARIAQQNRCVRDRVRAILKNRFGWTSSENDFADATALMTYMKPAKVLDSEAFVRRLWAAQVNISLVGRQHALWALESAGVSSLLRLTPHYFTTDTEIDQLANAIDQ